MQDNDLRICFIGDSFVHGSEDPEYLGWTGRVSILARERGYKLTCYDLGVRRETSSEIAARWELEARRRLPHPCTPYVVFSYGVNDTTVEEGRTRVPQLVSIENTRQILQTARQCDYRTALIGPPPIADRQHNDRTRQLSLAMGQVAKAEGVEFLSTFDALYADAVWMAEVSAGDGAHPGAAGYARFAALVDAWKGWWFRK
ncbi:MAG TPA: GDSL-type esterase/lipase family protein [Candidatus Limnocylindrales bacterium]|nr:GDSL-type esterase/lipase family protein [Candidatus Limnocylindrales bacterium]